MPFDAADLEVESGFAICEGGRSMVDLSTSPLRVCLCGMLCRDSGLWVVVFLELKKFHD